MNTQTLTKTRQTGAQVARVAFVVIPPVHIYPARVKLTAKLAEFEKALADLSDYQARAERASIDQDRALTDPELDESEAAERISKAQNERNVYLARQAQREKAFAALSAELCKVVNDAAGELRGLVSREVSRRESIITERVVAALQVGNAIDPTRMGPELVELMQFSGPVQVITALAPSTVIPTPGNHEISVRAAKDTLTKFEQVLKEEARNI